MDLKGTARLLAGLLLGGLAAVGHSADAPTWGALFDHSEPLAATLRAPIKALGADRDAEPEYRPGQLAWTDPDGTARSLDIRIRPRGKNRRDPATCRTPPLRLNLRTRDAEGSLFQGQDKLKLVTHCASLGTTRTSILDRLHLEVLAYRSYALLAPDAFRVRPLQLTYVDTGNDREVTQPAFLIEHRKQLAARLGLQDPKPEKVDRQQLEPDATAIAALFQYMIGNTDFSFIRGPDGDGCCHNLVVLQRPDGLFVPVPYDLDSTGLVNPPYAQPAAQLPIRRVTHRYYRGWCQDDDRVEATRQHFLTREQAILDLFHNHGALSDGGRRKALRFLGRFFEELRDPADWQRRYRRQCR